MSQAALLTHFTFHVSLSAWLDADWQFLVSEHSVAYCLLFSMSQILRFADLLKFIFLETLLSL